MRKIIAALHTTFDGVMSGPQGDEDNMVNWALPSITDSTPDFQRFFSMVHPVILGSGKRLFDNIKDRTDLKLESVKPYPSGAVLLRYLVSSQ